MIFELVISHLISAGIVGLCFLGYVTYRKYQELQSYFKMKDQIYQIGTYLVQGAFSYLMAKGIINYETNNKLSVMPSKWHTNSLHDISLPNLFSNYCSPAKGCEPMYPTMCSKISPKEGASIDGYKCPYDGKEYPHDVYKFDNNEFSCLGKHRSSKKLNCYGGICNEEGNYDEKIEDLPEMKVSI
jgi:hypothetical protein